MDKSEQKLRERITRAKGGHKRVLQARLDKLGSTAEVVEAPVEAPKPKRKKRAKKATKKD